MNVNLIAGLLVKVTCLLVAAFTVDALLRRRWVLTAAALWNAVLVALVVLPVATLLLPQWELPLLASRSPDGPNGSATVRASTVAANDAHLHSDDRPAGDFSNGHSLADGVAGQSLVLPGQGDATSLTIGKHTLWDILGWLYVAGLVAVLVRLAASWRAVDRLVRGAVPVRGNEWIKRLDYWQSDHWLAAPGGGGVGKPRFTRTIATTLRFPVRLLQSDEIDVPLALGVWRRAIVIPAHLAAENSHTVLDAILVHELAHLVRADCAWQWAQRIAEAAWWFHPLIWLARRRISFVRERACDDFAVYALGDVDAYAHSLLTVASAPTMRGSFGLGLAVVRRGNLSRRLEAIQRTQGNRQYNASRMVRGSCTLGILCGTLLLAVIVVAHASADPSIAQTNSSQASEGNTRERAKTNVETASSVAPAGVEAPATSANGDHAPDKSTAGADAKADQPVAEGKPALLKEALDGLEKTRRAIASYDVRLTVLLTIPMKTVIVDKKDLDQPSITKMMQWRPLEPGEEPKTRKSLFRQVRAHDGKRRVETERDEANRNQNTVTVDNGTIVRSLNEAHQGTIQQSREFRVQACEEYRNYLGDLIGMMPLQSLVRERPGTKLIENEKPDADLVGVLLPVGGGPSLKQLEFRVWLDRRHGFLPGKIEKYRREGEDLLLSSRMVVNQFHEAQPGVWVPIDMTQNEYNIQSGEYRGQVVNLYRVTVDVGRSRWNADLSEELFLLPFPAGIRVMDFVNSLQITTGEADDGRDLQALIQGAAKTQPVSTPATMRREQADLAKVRQEDREPAKALAKYGALLKANQDGAITSVDFLVLRRDGLGEPNIDDAGLQSVGKLSMLEHLGLSNTQITDLGLAQLRGLTKLKVLSLTNTNITDEGVKQLNALTSLEWLFLDNNRIEDGRRIRYVKITDEALRHLEPLQKLTHLQLYGTAITDAGLEHLKGLPNLQQVSLEGSDATRAGAEKLRAARPGLRVLID
jgi:hypothetical protein